MKLNIILTTLLIVTGIVVPGVVFGTDIIPQASFLAIFLKFLSFITLITLAADVISYTAYREKGDH